MKYSLLFLWLFAIVPCIYSQGPSFTGVQSPNAASLGTFGNIAVNYLTGTPDISSPLYTINDGNAKFHWF